MPRRIYHPRIPVSSHPPRIGRRPSALINFGLLSLLMGFAVYAGAPSALIIEGEAVLYEKIPVSIRVALWVSSGLLAVVAAYRLRWQNKGWMALTIMPAERAISHFWSFAQSVVPGDPPGTRLEGLALFFLWALIIRILLLVAGWDEDTVTTREG